MFEKPEMASGKDPKKQEKKVTKKKATERTAVEILPLPKHEKPFEDLTIEELEAIVKEYDVVIRDMMRKNTGAWNFDKAIAEAMQLQTKYKMRQVELRMDQRRDEKE